jgi:hypothetical protein
MGPPAALIIAAVALVPTPIPPEARCIPIEQAVADAPKGVVFRPMQAFPFKIALKAYNEAPPPSRKRFDSAMWGETPDGQGGIFFVSGEWVCARWFIPKEQWPQAKLAIFGLPT